MGLTLCEAPTSETKPDNNTGNYVTLLLPILRTTNYGLECTRYQAAKIWNSLPDRMRRIISLKEFKIR